MTIYNLDNCNKDFYNKYILYYAIKDNEYCESLFNVNICDYTDCDNCIVSKRAYKMSKGVIKWI